MYEYENKKTSSPKLNRTGIPDSIKSGFERRSGLSFDDVRIHYNSQKPSSLSALAYTQGTDVYIGPGQESSLKHELGHVVQQMTGAVRPTTTIGGLPVNNEQALEDEADRWGD